jgi:hypothetical protein
MGTQPYQSCGNLAPAVTVDAGGQQAQQNGLFTKQKPYNSPVR